MASPTDPEEIESNGEVEDETIFRNTYQTKILPPWQDPSKSTKSTKPDGQQHERTRHDYTVLLTDHNAGSFANTTRVGWKGRVDYSLREYEEEKQRQVLSQDDFYRDPNRLLEIALSTMILMASGSNVPEENYLATELYLRNIRNEYGDHPPNVAGLLRHINYLKKQQGIDYGKEYKTLPDANLVVTKISMDSRRSRIPVRIMPATPVDCADLQKELDEASTLAP